MSRNGARERALSTDTKITALFVVVGTVLWYGSMTVTDNNLVQFVLLMGVGIIVPTVINQLRAQ
jgi:hypothetical protein